MDIFNKSRSAFPRFVFALTTKRFFCKEMMPPPKWKVLKIDRSGLLNPHYGQDDDAVSEEKRVAKEAMSKLGEELVSNIKLRGPISMHEFMSLSANHIVHGYYQHKEDKIGSSGDFITAPELSQLFGEMLGLWVFSTWQALGSPRQMKLIELGPGKGTLMKDMLRTISQFQGIDSTLNVHMVELSATMRAIQKELLCGPGVDDGREVETKFITNEPRPKPPPLKTVEGVPISWHTFLNEVPVDGVPSVIIAQGVHKHIHTRALTHPAHSLSSFFVASLLKLQSISTEFLDTFPVHQFVYKENKWREKLVDMDFSAASPFHFKLVLSPTPTPAARTLIHDQKVLTSLTCIINTPPFSPPLGSCCCCYCCC